MSFSVSSSAAAISHMHVDAEIKDPQVDWMQELTTALQGKTSNKNIEVLAEHFASLEKDGDFAPMVLDTTKAEAPLSKDDPVAEEAAMTLDERMSEAMLNAEHSDMPSGYMRKGKRKLAETAPEEFLPPKVEEALVDEKLRPREGGAKKVKYEDDLSDAHMLSLLPKMKVSVQSALSNFQIKVITEKNKKGNDSGPKITKEWARVPTIFGIMNGPSGPIKPNTPVTDQIWNKYHQQVDSEKDANAHDEIEAFRKWIDHSDFDLCDFGKPDNKGISVPNKQGPHTCASIAINHAVNFFKQKAKNGSELRIRHFAALNELFVAQVDSPAIVARIIMSQEPKAFENNAGTSEAPNFKREAPGAFDESEPRTTARAEMLRAYLLHYQETYNVVAAFLMAEDVALEQAARKTEEDDPSGLGGGAETEPFTKNNEEQYNSAFDGVTRLLNLHPFGCYGWREQDAVKPSRGEMKVKNEQLYHPLTHDAKKFADERVHAAAQLIDGLQWERHFTATADYDEFLIKRVSLMLHGDVGIDGMMLDDIVDAIKDIQGVGDPDDIDEEKLTTIAADADELQLCAESFGSLDIDKPGAFDTVLDMMKKKIGVYSPHHSAQEPPKRRDLIAVDLKKIAADAAELKTLAGTLQKAMAILKLAEAKEAQAQEVLDKVVAALHKAEKAHAPDVAQWEHKVRVASEEWTSAAEKLDDDMVPVREANLALLKAQLKHANKAVDLTKDNLDVANKILNLSTDLKKQDDLAKTDPEKAFKATKAIKKIENEIEEIFRNTSTNSLGELGKLKSILADKKEMKKWLDLHKVACLEALGRQKRMEETIRQLRELMEKPKAEKMTDA